VVELPEEVVKNGDAFGTVLPPEVTTLLRRYRDHFLTPLLGREPTYLFDNGSGSPKLATTLSGLVQRTVYRRLGFKMGLHQFRHVGAKTLLDEDPSAHEAVRQLLGHKNMKTTTNFYAGLDTRRAARLHAKVIREILADNATLQPQGSRRQLQTRAFKLRSSKGRRRHE